MNREPYLSVISELGFSWKILRRLLLIIVESLDQIIPIYIYFYTLADFELFSYDPTKKISPPSTRTYKTRRNDLAFHHKFR